jgi:hypothetical protein
LECTGGVAIPADAEVKLRPNNRALDELPMHTRTAGPRSEKLDRGQIQQVVEESRLDLPMPARGMAGAVPT